MARAKLALNHLTRITAVEWAQFNVRVNAVAPWYFRTPLTESLLDNEDYRNEILERTPMRRIGETKELIGPVVFFASDASSYVTGQVLHIDGGTGHAVRFNKKELRKYEMTPEKMKGLDLRTRKVDFH